MPAISETAVSSQRMRFMQRRMRKAVSALSIRRVRIRPQEHGCGVEIRTTKVRKVSDNVHKVGELDPKDSLQSRILCFRLDIYLSTLSNANRNVRRSLKMSELNTEDTP